MLQRFLNADRSQNIPAVNISENDAAFLIEMAAPGYKKEDFKVSADKNVLTVSVPKKALENGTQNKKFYRREFEYGSFSRSFSLPEGVDTEKISGEYADGILTITVPKAEIKNIKQTIIIK